MRGLTHRQQRLEQIAFPSAVGSGHGIIMDILNLNGCTPLSPRWRLTKPNR